MNNQIIVFYIFLSVLFASSCTRNDNKTIYIDPDSKDQYSFDDFVKYTEIIPLETCEEALIKNITKVVFYKNQYFVKDIYEGLFVFDENGSFKRKIGRKGRGPGEYGYIADFCINRYNSNIEILSPRGTIMIYSIDGEFLTTINNNSIEVSNFLIVDKDLILFFHQSQVPVMTLYSRKKQSVIKDFFKVPTNFERKRPYPLLTPPFYIANGDTMIHYGYTNDVYTYSNQDITYKYSFDFGKHNFLMDDYEWSLELDKAYYRELLWKNKNIVFGFNNHFETERFILKQFYYKQGSWVFIIDKKKSKNFIIPVFMDLYTQNLNRSLGWEKLSLATETGTRLGIVLNWDSGPEYILTSVNAEKKEFYINLSSLDSKNRKIYDSISLSDNPVLVKYYLID